MDPRNPRDQGRTPEPPKETQKKELIALFRSESVRGQTASMSYWSAGQGLKMAVLAAILSGEKPEQVLEAGSSTIHGPEGSSSLAVAVRTSRGQAQSPALTDFDIEMQNRNATADIRNLAVTLLMPAEMTFVAATEPTPYAVIGKEVRYEPVVVLEPGDGEDFHLQVYAATPDTSVVANIVWDEFPRIPIT